MFLVVGESLVDLIGEAGSWRFEAAAGGSPLNVAVGLAAAGHPVLLASEVGADLFGDLVRDQLRRHGVDTSAVVAAATTSLAFARVDSSGAAGYDFRFRWDWTGPPPLAGVRCLHTGSLAATVAPGADAVATAVAEARRRGVSVSYDPNLRPELVGDRETARVRVERLVAAADVVKASSEDLAWLYPDTPDLTVAADWAGRGPWLVVVTRGGAGAVALAHGQLYECAAPPVTVVDTVGAGDAFTAGLLGQLARSLPGQPPPPELGEALRHAVATATAACIRRGAGPPPAATVAELLPATTATGRPWADQR